MRLHADSLFTCTAAGRMVHVNEPDGSGGPAPVFYLGRAGGTTIRRYRLDVPQDLIDELDALCLTEPDNGCESELPVHHEQYVRLITSRMGVGTVSAGPAYCVPDQIQCSRAAHHSAPAVLELSTDDTGVLQRWLHEWLDYLLCARPFLVAVSGESAVSVCCSVRITEQAHEAGVETAPLFRRSGYGLAAVAAWAAAVRAMGREPLYSTSWENTASLGVARKLCMTLIGVDFSVG